MPGKLLNKGLTGITHISVYLNNKVLTAHLSLSLSLKTGAFDTY